MKIKKFGWVYYVCMMLVGIALALYGRYAGEDSRWLVFFGAAFAVGNVIQLVRCVQYKKDANYQKRVDAEYTDERNAYIRMKAWSLAGYITVFSSAVLSFVLYAMKYTVISQTLGYVASVFLAVYLVCHIVYSKIL